MPMVTPSIALIARVGKLEAISKSAKSGEPVFTLMYVVLYGLSIFKRKKGSRPLV
jgi:hypothetical protein